MRLGKQRHESKYLAIEDFNTNKVGALAGCVISSALRGLHFYKWKHRIVPEQEQLNSEIGIN